MSYAQLGDIEVGQKRMWDTGGFVLLVKNIDHLNERVYYTYLDSYGLEISGETFCQIIRMATASHVYEEKKVDLREIKEDIDSSPLAKKFELKRVEEKPLQHKSKVTDLLESEIKTDVVNKATHYNQGKIEVIEAIEDWNLGFNLGNCVKYIARSGKKDVSKTLEDLKKAQYYLNREIKTRELK